MQDFSRRALLASIGSLAGGALLRGDDADGWTPLFDGKTLNGWTPSENKDSWKVVDGCLAGDGPRSHLFYMGPAGGADFRNFQLQAEVKTRPLCNSGIFFHTKYQEKGFPEQGFEVQVNNTARGEGNYLERKKTGSLYGVRNVYKQLVPDDQWFRIDVRVFPKNVQVRVNNVLVVDFVEPTPPVADPEGRGRFLQHGTFALQCHDPGSKVLFRNIRVRQGGSPAFTGAEPVVDDLYRQITALGAHNYPVVDYHAHLKGGWTIDQALANSRATGIFYGLAVNCGLNFPVQNDASAEDYLKSMMGHPCFYAMQAEGREWVKMFSPETIARFDYVFTDSMTFSHDGRRMRLWLPDEVGAIPDPDKFMDVIVDKTVGILEREPVDIYANPTFLPDVMAKEYDRFWSPDRRARVINAAKKNDIAIEINNRYKIPSPTFLKEAKAAGCKFSFGTNNTDSNIGRLEYPLAMVRECGLKWNDIFVPKPDGEKPVQKRGLPHA